MAIKRILTDLDERTEFTLHDKIMLIILKKLRTRYTRKKGKP